MGTERALISKGRVQEMRARGWTVVDTLAGSEDGEWAVMMEGPEVPASGFVHISEAVVAVIGSAEQAWRAHG